RRSQGDRGAGWDGGAVLQVPPMGHFEGLSALFSRDHADLSRAVIQIDEASAGPVGPVWNLPALGKFQTGPTGRSASSMRRRPHGGGHELMTAPRLPVAGRSPATSSGPCSWP